MSSLAGGGWASCAKALTTSTTSGGPSTISGGPVAPLSVLLLLVLKPDVACWFLLDTLFARVSENRVAPGKDVDDDEDEDGTCLFFFCVVPVYHYLNCCQMMNIFSSFFWMKLFFSWVLVRTQFRMMPMSRVAVSLSCS